MKTSSRLLHFFLGMGLIFSQFTEASGQCYIIKDSIIAGSGTGSFTDYVVDGIGRTLQAYYTDSGNTTGPSRAVVVIIDAGTNLPAEIKFTSTVGTPTLTGVIKYTYTNGKVSSIFDSTGNGTMTHTVSYDGNGNLKSVVLTNTTGNPDGFPGSFKNIVWQSGNISSLRLLIGTDSLELGLSFDTKNNIYKKLLNTEGAPNLFQAANNNNITLAVTTEPGTMMGNPVDSGTTAIQRNYTYNSNNDVVTLQDLPSLFDNSMRTTQYFYDCTVGINQLKVSEVKLHPNPANDIIYMDNGYFAGIIRLFDIKGKEVLKIETPLQTSSINISDLLPGMYFIEVHDGENVFQGKILKN